MPDPLYLDTCALDAALKGDAAINKQLSEARQAGRRLPDVSATCFTVRSVSALQRQTYIGSFPELPANDSQ